MTTIDMDRVQIFANAYLEPKQASKLMQDLRTLESKSITLHANDVDMIIQCEETLQDPGSEMLMVVQKAMDQASS